ncbi:MAG: thermonuclease family protein [Eubacteriales bacterium]|nr:thermonuclease family protein [Eubacteriales bacterium]
MKILIFIVFLLIPHYAEEQLNGKVIGVSDGDTIVFLDQGNKQIKVRLDGIDCPESKQPFGQKAKQFTVDFCFGKQVAIISNGIDRYGRVLGIVVVNNDTLNYELIKAGFAWHYKQYNKEPRLSDMEKIAREKRIGLWKDESPIPPWEWRRNN